MAGVAMRATARRWRGLGVGVRLGSGGFGRWAGGLRQQEKVPQVAQRFAARGMPQAVIADLVEAGWQDVLEEAPDELVAGDGFLALAVGGAVLVAIGHGLVVDGQDAVVGDGDTEGVAGEIVERGLLSLAPSTYRFFPIVFPVVDPTRLWKTPPGFDTRRIVAGRKRNRTALRAEVFCF